MLSKKESNMQTAFTSDVLRVFAVLFLAAASGTADPSYDLSHVDGMESFGGSAGAQEILAREGFVAAAPAFRQIFEPYINSPLPVLITADSAWHTYHFLLEEGVKRMEEAQGRRLATFSRLLRTAALEQAGNGAPEFADLAQLAAVGLAFQDGQFATNLNDQGKQIFSGLVSGGPPVAAPIGLALSPALFRPQSFYTQSSELMGYYRARQWYACVDFRLSSERETQLALGLSWLIESRPDLLKSWRELTAPYDAFVALPDDMTVSDYYRLAEDALGAKPNLDGLKLRGLEIQKRLRAHPKLPRINDQLLSPEEYVRFPAITAGFRLLPARQLSCAVCLQNSVEPKVAGRLCPSGLDFFAASSVLRSPAALRAEQAQAGEATMAAILQADPGAMPDSLYGQSMQALATLQKPLPAQAPKVFRSQAWSDLKLWTQLGAWAEERHTWALHAKPAVEFMGLAETPPGMVEPCPEFFAALAKLCRQTATALDTHLPIEPFDARKTAQEALEAKALLNKMLSTRHEITGSEEKLHQYSALREYITSKGDRDVSEDTLKRLAQSGPTNPVENEMLRRFYNARTSIPPLLTNLAAACDRLSGLAALPLAGKEPTAEDGAWISQYGILLAGFHLYEGNSWLEPADDFPILSAVFHIPVKSSVLYAAVGRPQALYVILPYHQRLQLYRGAVLSYREFAAPASVDLTDEKWREMTQQTDAPAPPLFTKSFLQAAAPDDVQSNRLSGLSFAEGDFKKPPSSSIQLRLTQTKLAPASDAVVSRFMRERAMSSDDERHVIFVERKDGKQRLVRDGVAEELHDTVQSESFTPDSKHVVYVAVDGVSNVITNSLGRQHDALQLESFTVESNNVSFVAVEGGVSRVIKDGVASKPYCRIVRIWTPDGVFIFSPGGSRVAYTAVSESKKQCMVVDGEEGSWYDEIISGSFSFSAEGRHYVYAARQGKTGYVVKDNQVAVQCDANGWQNVRQGPYLSADGEHLACIIKRGSQFFANVDGKDSHPWTRIDNAWQTSFSSDGRHFSYEAQDARGTFNVVDDQEFPKAGFAPPATFSPDGKNWAVVNSDKTGNWVNVNGKAGKKYSGTIMGPTFSPDGRRLGYTIEGRPSTKAIAVIHDEQDFEGVMPELFGGIRFSPDSKHFAIMGTRGGTPVVIVDGVQYPWADSGASGGEVIFSPDGERWAYLASHGGRIYWVISAAEYGPYGAAPKKEPAFGQPNGDYNEQNLYFGPEGRHFAFRASRENKRYLVVDGLEQEFDAEWFPSSAIVFDTAAKFHFIVRNQQEIDFVEGEISQREADGSLHSVRIGKSWQ
jgi:Tol biopolymer transport system component